MLDLRTVSENQTDRRRWYLYKTSAHKQVESPAIQLKLFFLRVKQGRTPSIRVTELFSIPVSQSPRTKAARARKREDALLQHSTAQHSTAQHTSSHHPPILLPQPRKQTPHTHLRIQLAIHTPHTHNKQSKSLTHYTPHIPQTAFHTPPSSTVSSHQKAQNAALLFHPQRMRTLGTQITPLTLERQIRRYRFPRRGKVSTRSCGRTHPVPSRPVKSALHQEKVRRPADLLACWLVSVMVRRWEKSDIGVDTRAFEKRQTEGIYYVCYLLRGGRE